MSKNKPKIVIFDLETLPDPERTYDVLPSYGLWNGRGFNGETQSIMCFAYKIVGQKRAHSINAWDFKNWKTDRYNDIEVIKAAREILVSADAIVTHNGKKFDLPVFNTRLKYHGLPRLPKIHHIDTKDLVKRNLSLYNNSLANVAEFLNLTDKIHWSDKWNTWTKMGFHKESAKDRKQMDKYAKYDVIVTEEVFEEMREYATNIPNHNLFNGANDVRVCPSCGGSRLHKHGKKITKTKTMQRYQCQDCGTISTTDSKDRNIRSEG